jgi:hypothetical protein
VPYKRSTSESLNPCFESLRSPESSYLPIAEALIKHRFRSSANAVIATRVLTVLLCTTGLNLHIEAEFDFLIFLYPPSPFGILQDLI